MGKARLRALTHEIVAVLVLDALEVEMGKARLRALTPSVERFGEIW